MKKLFNITLLLLATVFILSCRNGDDDIPEDIHEHDEIGKVVLTLTNKADATDIQTVNVIGGVADAHLHLHQEIPILPYLISKSSMTTITILQMRLLKKKIIILSLLHLQMQILLY